MSQDQVVLAILGVLIVANVSALLLGFVVYPVLIGLAWAYVRRAERNEDAFGDMVGREESA